MNRAVFDASTLLALLLNEPTIDLLSLLDRAFISAVNLAEVKTKLADLGKSELDSLPFSEAITVVDFTEKHASIAASLRPLTRHLGLSLGDRACLALGIALAADVYTADRSWLTLPVACPIHYVRP